MRSDWVVDGLRDVSAGRGLLVPLQPLHHRPVALLQGRHVLQPGEGGGLTRGLTGGLLGLLQAEEAGGSCAVERSGSRPLRPGLGHTRGFPPGDVSELQIIIKRGFTAEFSYFFMTQTWMFMYV